MSGERWVAGAYALDIWEGVLMSRPEAAQTAVAAHCKLICTSTWVRDLHASPLPPPQGGSHDPLPPGGGVTAQRAAPVLPLA